MTPVCQGVVTAEIAPPGDLTEIGLAARPAGSGPPGVPGGFTCPGADPELPGALPLCAGGVLGGLGVVPLCPGGAVFPPLAPGVEPDCPGVLALWPGAEPDCPGDVPLCPGAEPELPGEDPD